MIWISSVVLFTIIGYNYVLCQSTGFTIKSHSCKITNNSVEIIWKALPDPSTFDFSIKDLEKAYPIQSFTVSWYSQLTSKIEQKSVAKFKGALSGVSFPVRGDGIREGLWRLDGISNDFYNDVKSLSGEISDFEYRGLRPTSVKYTIDNLKYAHVYNFGVRANPRKGAPVPNGGYGNMNFSCIIATDPGIPSKPTAFNVALFTKNIVTITWKPPYKKNGVVLEYAIKYQEIGNDNVTTITVPADKRTYRIKGLRQNGHYSFRMAAANLKNVGEYTEIIKIRMVAKQFEIKMAFPPGWMEKYPLSPSFTEIHQFPNFINELLIEAFDITAYKYLGFGIRTTTMQKTPYTFFRIHADIYFEKAGQAKASLVQNFLRNAASAPPLLLMKQIYVRDVNFCGRITTFTDCHANATCEATHGLYTCACPDNLIDIGGQKKLLPGRDCVGNTDPPIEFEGMSRNPTTVDLSWMQPENIVGKVKSYELESKTDIKGKPVIKKALLTSVDFFMEHTFENLPRSSMHQFRIRAITTTSPGDWSDWLKINTNSMIYSISFVMKVEESIMNYQDIRDRVHADVVRGASQSLRGSSEISYRDMEVLRSDYRGQNSIEVKAVIYLQFTSDDTNPIPIITRIMDAVKGRLVISGGNIDKDTIEVTDYNECGTSFEQCNGNICENVLGTYKCKCPYGNIDVSEDFHEEPGRRCMVFDAPGSFVAKTLNPRAAQLIWTLPSQMREQNLKFRYLVQYKKKNSEDVTDVIVENTNPNFHKEGFVMKAPIEGLDTGVEYSFRVAHQNAKGIGRFTNWQSTKTSVNIYEIQLNLTTVIYNDNLNDKTQEASITHKNKVISLLNRLLGPRIASYMNAGEVKFTPGIKDRSYANAEIYFAVNANIDVNQVMELFRVNQIPDAGMGLDFTSVHIKDFNECESKWKDCSKDGLCENLMPGYRCRCRDRYIDIGSQQGKLPGRVCKATAAATQTTTTTTTKSTTTRSTTQQQYTQPTTTTQYQIQGNQNLFQNSNDNQQQNSNQQNNNQQQNWNQHNNNQILGSQNQQQNNNQQQNWNQQNNNQQFLGNQNQQQNPNQQNNNQQVLGSQNQQQSTVPPTPAFPTTVKQTRRTTTEVPPTPTFSTLGTTVSLIPLIEARSKPGVLLSGAAIGLNRIQLSWQRISDYSTNTVDLVYVIQYTIKGSATWKQTHATAALPHLIINSLIPNVVYRIRLAEKRRGGDEPYTEFTDPIEVRTSPHIYRMFFQLPTVAPEDVVNQKYSPTYNQLHMYISDYATRIFTNHELIQQYPQIEFGSAGEISFQAHVDKGTTATFLIYMTDRRSANAELLKKAFISIQDKYLMQKEIVLIGITDFDECSAKDYNDCHKWAQCKNTEGSYTCLCVAGFKDTSEEYYLLRGRVCTGIATVTTPTTTTTTTTRPTTTTLFRPMNAFPTTRNNLFNTNSLFSTNINNNFNNPAQLTTKTTTVRPTTMTKFELFSNRPPPATVAPTTRTTLFSGGVLITSPHVTQPILTSKLITTPPKNRFFGMTSRLPSLISNMDGDGECKPGTWKEGTQCVDIVFFDGSVVVTHIDSEPVPYGGRHRLGVRAKAESAIEFVLKSSQLPGFLSLTATTMKPPSTGGKGVEVNMEIIYKKFAYRKRRRRQVFNSIQPRSVSPLDIQTAIISVLSSQNVKGMLRGDPGTSIRFDVGIGAVKLKDFNECVNKRKYTYCSPVGSLCKNTPGSFECECNSFYVDISHDKINRPGELCEDKCLPNPCKNGGKCQRNKPINETCVCDEKWTGRFCTEEVDLGFQNLTLVIAVVGVIAFLVIVICTTICILRFKKKKKMKKKDEKKKRPNSSDESSDESDDENLKKRPFAGIEKEIKPTEHIAPIPALRPSKINNYPPSEGTPIPQKRGMDSLAASQSVVLPAPRRPPKPPSYAASTFRSSTDNIAFTNENDFNNRDAPPLPPRLGSVPASALQSHISSSRTMNSIDGFEDDIPPKLPPKPPVLHTRGYNNDEYSSDEESLPPPIPRKPDRFT